MKATNYDLLAQFYKYSNPELHIQYYKKHLKYLQLALHTSETINIPNPFMHTRFINLLKTKIDIRLNGIDILKNVPPYGVSEYFIVPINTYQLDILPVDDTEKIPLKRQQLDITGENYSTFIITENQIHKFATEQYLPENETKLRVIHLSVNTPNLDVRVKGGDIVFPNISYGTATEYLGLSPMTVNLELTASGSKNIILPLPNIILRSNNIYSLNIIEDSTKQNGINTFLIKD